MKIEKGPFAGTEIPENEITSFMGNDGEMIPFWPTHARTPLFLDRFKAEDGWQIVISNERGSFDLPDTRSHTGLSNPGQVFVQPTHLFVATLRKGDQVYAQASTLAIIDGPSAWERGETMARGRLYEAAGLPGFLKHTMVTEGVQNAPQAKATIPNVATIPIAVAPVSAAEASSMPSSRRAEAEEIEDQPTAQKAPSQEAAAEGSDRAKVVSVTPKVASSNRGRISREVNENLRDQILVLAQSRQVEIPVIADDAKAKEVYKKLLKGEELTELAS